MPNQQLIDFINQSRQKGLTDSQIRQELLGAGWPESEVDQSLGLPELSTRRSHKKVILTILIVVTILALGVGGYFGYGYWQKGQPAYSLNQFKIAFQKQDTATIQKYIDIDSIFNNFWPRIKTRIRQYSSQYTDYDSSLISKYLEDSKSDLQDDFRNGLYEASRGNKEGRISEILAQLFEIKNPDFTINGNTAILKMVFKRGGKSYNFDVIFSKQADKTWRITDIQGLESVFEEEVLAGSQRDKIRTIHLQNISVALELYWDDHNNEYPNSLSLLLPYFDKEVPMDPLDNKPYKYSYSVSGGKILYYHLGASLEDKTNDALDSDADCYSTTPPLNCSSLEPYANGFSGSDKYGCDAESERACYDITRYVSTP